MNNGNRSGEVCPMIDREPPNAAETQGAASGRRSVRPRGRFAHPESCPSLWNAIVGFQKLTNDESRVTTRTGPFRPIRGDLALS
jgi:hypothetical protein